MKHMPARNWLFLVYVKVVPIHNSGDSKRPKGILKAIGEYAYDQSTTTESLTESMLQQRDQREMKTMGKTTEAAMQLLV